MRISCYKLVEAEGVLHYRICSGTYSSVAVMVAEIYHRPARIELRVRSKGERCNKWQLQSGRNGQRMLQHQQLPLPQMLRILY